VEGRLVCYGNDAAGVSFYSDLAGSGGNVSWSMTLPVDAAPTENQSDLYSAVWLGMAMRAPSAWLDECYLELQFYPDSSWSVPGGTLDGNWVAYAVGWQIEAATGSEDACYATPLYVGGDSSNGYFNMAQGDHISVNMTGWSGSPNGENIVVKDLSSGVSSSLAAFNSTGNYPVDPAYSENSWSDSLLWSPGGELPVTLAFETGHAGNPAYPSNDSFGGCSPGAPPPTPTDPAVPCPSYDPGSWVNDTAQPLKVAPPTFFNSDSAERPSQVDFSQGFGGINGVTGLSGGACGGDTGSAFCSYPWFSYSCGVHAFEFGATDYPGVTSDFGQYNEYDPVNSTNGLGWLYYPPSAYSIPACKSAGVNVTVSTGSGGSVNVLGTTVLTSSTLRSLTVGAYAILSTPNPGEYFSRWSTTGGVSVLPSQSPVAAAEVSGPGNITAVYSSVPSTVQVWFNDSPVSGVVAVFSGATYSTGLPIANVTSGGSLELAPGAYSIEAYPSPGHRFSEFQTLGPGAEVAAVGLPYTYLLVTGSSPTASVTATYTVTRETAHVWLEGVGRGSLVFNGTVVPFNDRTNLSALNLTVPIGTYALSAEPMTGWSFLLWQNNGSSIQADMGNSTRITLENGSSFVTALFGAQLRLLSSASSAGQVMVGNTGPWPNGSVETLAPGTYKIDAIPAGNESFEGWAVSNRSAAWVLRSSYPITKVELNSSATVTASFGAALGNPISFGLSLAGAGTITFNGDTHYSSNVTNDSVSNGSYLLTAQAHSGYRFVGWTVTGPLTFTSGILAVRGGPGNVTARFVVKLFPVTFIGTPPSAVSGILDGSAIVSGHTLVLAMGNYPLVAVVAPNTTFGQWSSTLPIGSPTSMDTTLSVTGAGTIGALAVPYTTSPLTESRNVTDVGLAVTFSVVVNGSDPFELNWSGLPTGCTSEDSPQLVCVPTVPGWANVTVSVTGSSGVPISPPGVTLHVLPLPAVLSFRGQPATVDVGVPVAFAAVVQGGLAPLAYTFLNLPPGCRSTDAPTLDCAPGSSGNYTVELSVSDALGETSTGFTTLTVHPDPTISGASVTPAAVTVNRSVLFLVAVSGGTAPILYSYGGLPQPCGSTDSPRLACMPSSPGRYEVRASTEDSLGRWANSTIALLVNPAPSVSSFTVSPTAPTLGENLSFVLAATGGTGPLVVSYGGLPAGCSSADSFWLNCTANATGTFVVHARVTDQFGSSANASLTFTVSSAPTTGSSGGSGSHYVLLVALVALAGVAVLAFVYWFTGRPVKPPRK
jgi:hypothetical protein